MSALLLLVVVSGIACLLLCLRGVRVFDQPDATLLRSRTVLRTVAAVAAAAAIGLLPDWPRQQPAEGFIIHSGYQFDLLAGFFLWLALSGLLSFAASVLFVGGLVRPRSRAAASSPARLDHRAMLAAAEKAEDVARRRPLVEPLTFLVFALLAVLALARMDAREVRGDLLEGLESEGFLPASGRRVPWSEVEALVLQVDGKPNERQATWRLVDGSQWSLRGASLWRLDDATVERVVQVAEAAGLRVERRSG